MVISKRFTHIEDAKKFIGDAVRYCSDKSISPFYIMGEERTHHNVERWDWLSIGSLFENIDRLLKFGKDGRAAICCYDFVVDVEYTNLVWYVHIDFWRIDNHTIICIDPYAIISYIRVHFHGDEKFNSLVEDLIGGKIHSSENDSCQKMYLLQGKIFNEVALLTAVPANAESMPNVGGYLHKDIVNYFINPYLDSERYFLELFRSDALVRKQKE